MSRKRTREQNEAAIKRAADAKAIVEQGVIGDAFRLIEREAINRLRQATTPAESFNSSVVLQVSEQVSQMLKAFIADGENAAKDIERAMFEKRTEQQRELSHANYLTAAREARSASDTFATAIPEEQPNA